MYSRNQKTAGFPFNTVDTCFICVFVVLLCVFVVSSVFVVLLCVFVVLCVY